jgi:hypothetical protein
MTFDTRVPLKLKRLQQWFGSVITRPIDEDSRMLPLSPKGIPMEEEASDYIRPSPTLRPAQRIQIYNQQYWWRFLSILQENYPLLTRLFGYHEFNFRIAIPYICKYPSQHWSLSTLGNHLPQWIASDYQGDDKEIVLKTAEIEWAYGDMFYVKHYPPPTAADLPQDTDPSHFLSLTLFLQPHVHLFEMPYDLFSFRRKMLEQEPEYWITHDFPELSKDKTYYFVLYRTPSNFITWNSISYGEFTLLHLFKEGSSIEAACDWLEEQEGAACEEAGENIHHWFQEWMIRQLLTQEPPPTRS